MEYVIRDIAAIVIMLTGIALIFRMRNVSSLVVCLLLAVFVWLTLFRRVPSVETSICILIGYIFASSPAIISTGARSTWNRKLVRFFFGKRGEERWMAALNRMRDREIRAKERGVSVVDVLKEDTAKERQSRAQG
jgi:hypothetical protein